MTYGFTSLIRTALVVVFLAAAARPAAADWLFTPYVGVVFGGAANTFDVDEFDDVFESRFTFGGALSYMGGGIFGFEVDYSLSPNFFQFQNADEDIELLDLDSSVQTFMGNLIVGIPVGGTTGGGVRPYVAGGLGLLRANVESPADLFDNLSTNELGFNVGGGLHVFFSDNVGIRGDIRYFRAIEQGDDDPGEDDDFFEDDFDLEDFDYWRATVGVTFRFGG